MPPGNRTGRGYFKPGQGSPNPGGRPKMKAFTQALRQALAINEQTGDSKVLIEVAQALVSAARDGDVVAIREVADRLEGKVPQGITGDPDNPLEHKVEIIHTFKSSV